MKRPQTPVVIYLILGSVFLLSSIILLIVGSFIESKLTKKSKTIVLVENSAIFKRDVILLGELESDRILIDMDSNRRVTNYSEDSLHSLVNTYDTLVLIGHGNGTYSTGIYYKLLKETMILKVYSCSDSTKSHNLKIIEGNKENSVTSIGKLLLQQVLNVNNFEADIIRLTLSVVFVIISISIGFRTNF